MAQLEIRLLKGAPRGKSTRVLIDAIELLDPDAIERVTVILEGRVKTPKSHLKRITGMLANFHDVTLPRAWN